MVFLARMRCQRRVTFAGPNPTCVLIDSTRAGIRYCGVLAHAVCPQTPPALPSRYPAAIKSTCGGET